MSPGKMLLAHVASAQGVTAAESIAGLNSPRLDYDLMPRAIYCRPQVASFGLTEAQARERRPRRKIGKFPMVASGRRWLWARPRAWSSWSVDAEIGEVLGAHMIGSEVTELLGELGAYPFAGGYDSRAWLGRSPTSDDLEGKEGCEGGRRWPPRERRSISRRLPGSKRDRDAGRKAGGAPRTCSDSLAGKVMRIS